MQSGVDQAPLRDWGGRPISSQGKNACSDSAQVDLLLIPESDPDSTPGSAHWNVPVTPGWRVCRAVVGCAGAMHPTTARTRADAAIRAACRTPHVASGDNAGATPPHLSVASDPAHDQVARVRHLTISLDWWEELPMSKCEIDSHTRTRSGMVADKVNGDSAADDALESALSRALKKADRAAEKVARAQKRASRSKKSAKRAEQRADLAEERADLARRKAKRWKDRARAAEVQIAVLQDLNRQLTTSYREDRAADAAAMHFAAEAVAAFAADAVALREINRDEDNPEYLDHLTFRLRQNLLEARSFLDEQGEVGRSADLADLLNALPPNIQRR